MAETVVEYSPTNLEVSLAIQKEAEKIVIVSQEQCELVANLKSNWKTYLKEREEYWEPLQESSYEAYQGVLSNKKAECEPVRKAIGRAQKMMDDWSTEQLRIIIHEQQRLEAEAVAKAEKEKLKLLEQAVKLEEKGQIEKAEEKLEKAEEVFPEPVFAKIPPKTIKTTYGINITTKSDIEIVITNTKLLALEIGNGRIPLSAMKLCEVELKKWAKFFGKKGKEVPGMIIREIVKTSVK